MAHQVAISGTTEETLPPQRLPTFHSLRYRDFNYLVQGQLGAAASLWMEQVARPFLILSLTDSALMVGLLQATRMIPQLIFGVLGGVIADRMDKRRILLVTKSVTLASHFTTGMLILTGAIEPWMVFATTFVTGSSMAFDAPARQSLIPRLVPPENLENAIALNLAAMNLMRIGGASLAGLILVLLDYGELYMIQSAMYVWVIFCTLRISVRTQEEKLETNTSMLTELMEGFAAVRRDPTIFYILVISLVLFVFCFPYQSVFVPLIAKESLGIGDSGGAILISVTGIGALIGSLSVATFGSNVRRRGLFMIGIVLIFCTALLFFARVELVLLAVPALIVTGAMQTSFMSLNNAYVLSRTPPELQGRIMSLFSLDRGLIPLGAALAGFLSEALGPQDGLMIMAGACIVCTLVMAITVPSLRRIR